MGDLEIRKIDGREVIVADHWSEIPIGAWSFKHFTPAELASKGDGSLRIDLDALKRLDRLRERIGAPMLVTSAYRDPEHNRRVGGAKGSYHLRGQAFDIRMDNHDPAAFEIEAAAVGFRGFGFYPDHGFMHIDTGPARSWGTRFPARETRFAPEPKSERAKKAAKEAVPAAAVVVAAERVVNEAAPMLPDDIVTMAFAALAFFAFALIAWRAINAGRE